MFPFEYKSRLDSATSIAELEPPKRRRNSSEFTMKAYLILALVVLGHLSQIQAAAISTPKNTVQGGKELEQKIYEALMDKHEDIIEATNALRSSTDNMANETEEQFIVSLIAAVVAGIAAGAAQARI
ncbi:uncharacterized protein LOC144110129 [Amblyomma americanum]